MKKETCYPLIHTYVTWKKSHTYKLLQPKSNPTFSVFLSSYKDTLQYVVVSKTAGLNNSDKTCILKDTSGNIPSNCNSFECGISFMVGLFYDYRSSNKGRQCVRDSSGIPRNCGDIANSPARSRIRGSGNAPKIKPGKQYGSYL